jgi:hypothetical protein
MVLSTDTIQTNINKLFGNKHKVSIYEGYANRMNFVSISYPLIFATKNDEVHDIVSDCLVEQGYTIKRIQPTFDKSMMVLQYFISSTLTGKRPSVGPSYPEIQVSRPPMKIYDDIVVPEETQSTKTVKFDPDEPTTILERIWNLVSIVLAYSWSFLGLLNQLGFYIKVVLLTITVFTFFIGMSSPVATTIPDASKMPDVFNATTSWSISHTIHKFVGWILRIPSDPPISPKDVPVSVDELDKLRERANHIEQRILAETDDIGEKDKMSL